MNILVTGGAGFIGSYLVERLIELGHHVCTLVDMSNGRPDFLDQARKSNRYSMVHGSLTDKDLLGKLMERCDLVFHLAAVLGVKNTVEDPIKVIEGNINGTLNILDLAHQHHIKVVFVSLLEIYGKNSNLPFKEDSDRILGAPSVHRWCNATAKVIDEHLCFAYVEKGLPVTIVRYFNVYGPRQTSSQYGGVVPRFIKAALNGAPLEVYGEGTQTRCFTFIHDMIAGTVVAMDPKANGLAFNIGSEDPITILDLAKKIRDLTDSSSPIHFVTNEKAYGIGYEDMPARIPDLTHSQHILQYKQSVMLDEGLRITMDWYRQQ
jgi:UDP-glucose 4-epimerase